MIVISNTTPIISLIKIDRLSLLQKLYGTVTIPESVYSEIEAGKDKDYYIDLKTVNFINIETITNREARDYLVDLDDGEAEVIVLAREKKADLVIIDETRGRSYADRFNLRLTGVVGVLLRAKEKGFIDAVAPLLEELINKGIWLSRRLVEKARKLAGE